MNFEAQTTQPAMFQPQLALGQEQTAQVLHQDERGAFLIEFRFNPAYCTIPATYPAGCPHYAAKIEVWRVAGPDKALVCPVWDGTYTGGKCYEDRPADLVSEALRRESDLRCAAPEPEKEAR